MSQIVRRIVAQTDSVADQRVFLGLLALVFWAPLPLGSNRTWAAGILLTATIALLGYAAWVWRFRAQKAAERLRPFAVPLAVLGLIVALTWLQATPLPANWVEVISPMAAQLQAGQDTMTLSLDVFQTRLMAGLGFTYWCAFALVVLTVRTPERLDTLAYALVLSGVLQAAIGAVLFSMKAKYSLFFVELFHDRMRGTYVYQNAMAGYMCMCLSVGIGLMLARLGQGEQRSAPNWQAKARAVVEFILSPKMRLRLFLVIMVIALVLTRSRMGNTAFFASMLVVGTIGALLARRTAPRTVALIVSLIIIDIFVVGAGVGLDKVVERIQETELTNADGGKAESIEARTEAARTALALVDDYAWVGSGAGSFYNVFIGYRSPSYGYTYVDHTHNDFVELASDFGLLGLTLFGVLVASTLVVVVRVMAQRQSTLPWGIAFGVAMAIVALLLHSTVDFNLQIPANALTITVILAMGWIAKELPSKGRRRKSTGGTGGVA